VSAADDIDNARDFDMVRAVASNVLVTCLPDDTIMIPRADTLTLLQVVLTAIRTEGDEAKSVLAAKVCMSHLGRKRFA
jgi:hypothetical protein